MWTFDELRSIVEDLKKEYIKSGQDYLYQATKSAEHLHMVKLHTGAIAGGEAFADSVVAKLKQLDQDREESDD
jgi:hypothetical protein